MSMDDRSYISFPPGAVTDDPLRIPLLWDGEVGLALDKPPGLAAFQDTRVGGGPSSILTAINHRLATGAEQFERLGAQKLFSVNLLERESSGIVLYAKNEEGRTQLKNAMGSCQFTFRYRFLTAVERGEDELFCDLPLAVHREKPLALVSHRTGKKTTTAFRCLERFRTCSLWETASPFDRFHQVRLHAAEVGLPVLGETLYCNVRPRGGEVATASENPPAGDEFFLHLFGLRFPAGETWVDLEARYPSGLSMFLKKVARPGFQPYLFNHHDSS